MNLSGGLMRFFDFTLIWIKEKEESDILSNVGKK